ncbi:hypothetical protein CRI93_03885 [Longimonas halophila]|uniref:Uncharacterized protein n=1 Tax=Longimonas halophila TaxID=1469170 RepID=A0A2H3NW35_9BACT|nr:hypothetical protein CRI93_03885 [Longimonas halophila]
MSSTSLEDQNIQDRTTPDLAMRCGMTLQTAGGIGLQIFHMIPWSAMWIHRFPVQHATSWFKADG